MPEEVHVEGAGIRFRRVERPRLDAGVVEAAHPMEFVRSNAVDGYTISVDQGALGQVVLGQTGSVTKIFETLDMVGRDLVDFFPKLKQVLPSKISGQLVNPDGTPAAYVSVEADQPAYGPGEGVNLIPWSTPRTITDERGAFQLQLPRAPIPDAGLELTIKGTNNTANVTVRRIDLIDPAGKLGVIPINRTLTALPRSILAQVKGLVPTGADDAEEAPQDFATPAPSIMLGEGDCARSFRSSSGVIDRFSYSLLVRLIDPQVTPRHLVVQQKLDGNEKYLPLPIPDPRTSLDADVDAEMLLKHYADLGNLRFVDRVPVDRPIDVAQFHSDVQNAPLTVPKASSLGLGYIVKLHQTWIPAGLSLGELLYSLALMPGEEERVAVFERSEAMSISDTESLSMDEAQEFRESADSSTLATFNSAYDEEVRAGSRMRADSNTWGIGGVAGLAGIGQGVLGAIGVAGGYGSASSSGSTSSWQKGSRDFVSSATENFHSQLARQAAARRRSSRTGVRLASASERTEVRTKVVANHNKCHALTMQYWSVLRHFAVSSNIDDVQLMAFIPLELIAFRQPNQLDTLPDLVPPPQPQPGAPPPGQVPPFYTRSNLLARYRALIQYHDVLVEQLRRRPDLMHGLQLLDRFVSDPTTTVQQFALGQQDIVTISIVGTFLPFEEVTVSVVTKTGARVGPLLLSGQSAPIPADTFTNGAELLDSLRARRFAQAGETRTATMILPESIGRTDVARFELRRAFRPLTYRLKLDLTALDGVNAFDLINLYRNQTVTYSPSQLEQELGGPYVWDATAAIQGTGEKFVNAFSGRSSAIRMGTLEPIPTLRVPPILRFSDLLRMESTYQHVVRNTVPYSKAVWLSLTPEERAILLERYTIGVPSGGVSDASQEVPLLSCVANQVVGFHGNSAVMPFSIPPQAAERMKVTTRDIQEALLKFHRDAFVPPRSAITLSTQGMLGEAVLGSCSSCEQIDLTRFWNWADSPGDQASKIEPADLRSQPLLSGQTAAAPSDLVPTQPVNLVSISTGNNAPAPDSTLLADMMKQLPQATSFADITGAARLAELQKDTLAKAESARKESLDAAKSVTEKLIDGLPKAMQAAHGIDEETKKKQAENEAADQKAKDEANTKKTALQKEGVATLTGKAGEIIDYVASLGSDDARSTFANALKQTFWGTEKVSPLDTPALFKVFKDADNDSADVKAAKKSFRDALGLQ